MQPDGPGGPAVLLAARSLSHMGLYIRKSLSVGPFRFNLSKSGIGVSTGVRGFRVGAGPRGNYVHMGRGGLYFRQSLDSAHPGHASPSPNPPRFAHSAGTVGPFQEIESGSVMDMVDGSSEDLLKELNDKRQKVTLRPFALVGSALVTLLFLNTGPPAWQTAALAVTCGVACWQIGIRDAVRKTTVIFYDLESDIEHAYERLHDAFGEVTACGAAWHVSAHAAVRDRKYHAGAGKVVSRHRTALRADEPPFVKTNVDVPLIPVGKQTLALMPDRVLVFDRAAVGAIGYRDLRVERQESQFIEDGAVASDATVVGNTWQYVNKKGGPDRRFANNRELPICLYDTLHFSSSSGLNELVQLSKSGAGRQFTEALALMRSMPQATGTPPVESERRA